MLYFVKDNVIHHFPVSSRCSARRDGEQLRDTLPDGVARCVYCMRLWPADND